MDTLLLAIAAAEVTARVRVSAAGCDGKTSEEGGGGGEEKAQADERDGELMREYK